MQAEHAKQKDSSEREIARLRAEMGRIATGIIATEMGRTPSADPSRATSERGSIFSDSSGGKPTANAGGRESSREGGVGKVSGGRRVVRSFPNLFLELFLDLFLGRFHVEGPSAFRRRHAPKSC